MSANVAGASHQSTGFQHQCKTGYKHFKKGVAFLVKQTGDGGTVNAVAKFARRFFELLAAFGPVMAFLGPAGVFFKNFTEVYKVLSIFKNGQELLNAEKIRKLAVAALGITVSCLSLAKIVDAFGWVSIANISASFGKIAVIGSIAIVPVGVFISWLEAVKASIEISLSVSSLLKVAKKVSEVNKKKRFWETPINLDKCNQKVHEYRKEGKELAKNIYALEQKQEKLQLKVDKWSERQEELNAIIAKRRKRLKGQNKAKRCFANTITFAQKIRAPKVTRKLRKWQKLNDKVLKDIKENEVAIEKKFAKKTCWQRMGQRYDHHIPKRNKARYAEDIKKIEEMRLAKFKQMKVKKSNLRLQQLKDVLSIIMNIGIILVAAGTTTVFILGAVGVVTTPGGGLILGISLAALGLSIATFGLGFHFFKMYKGKKTKKVALPELSDAKKWKKNRKSLSHKSNTTSTDETSESAKISEKKLNKKKRERDTRHLADALSLNSSAA